jgi:hypothetical protein
METVSTVPAKETGKKERRQIKENNRYLISLSRYHKDAKKAARKEQLIFSYAKYSSGQLMTVSLFVIASPVALLITLIK